MIFKFWEKLPHKECIHPDDKRVIEKHKDIFELHVPPGHVNGNLKTAPVIALFLNPGFEDQDKQGFEDEDCRALLFEQIKGESDFPLWFNRWRKWFLPRVRLDGMSDEEIAKNVSIFNVCSYASKNAKLLKPSILNSLPSTQAAIDYLHEELIPQAQRGERFIVVCRAAWAWKLDKSIECDTIKFVKNPRGGHFGPDIRAQIKKWMNSKSTTVD